MPAIRPPESRLALLTVMPGLPTMRLTTTSPTTRPSEAKVRLNHSRSARFTGALATTPEQAISPVARATPTCT